MKKFLIVISVIVLTVSCYLVSYAVSGNIASEEPPGREIVAQSVDEIKSKYNLNNEIDKKQCVGDIFNSMGISEKQSDIILQHFPEEIIDGFAYAESYGYTSRVFSTSNK